MEDEIMEKMPEWYKTLMEAYRKRQGEIKLKQGE